MPRISGNTVWPSETRNRTCPRCRETFPATELHFYLRPSTGRLEYCHACSREYGRQAARRARRGGTGRVTARRPDFPGQITDNGDLESGRRFGLEIEFIGDYNRVIREMTQRGLGVSFEGYNHRVRSQWKIVTDASVSRGAELVSPPLRGEAGRRQVRLACEALRAAGASVNQSTGLHVHSEAVDLTPRQFGRVFRFWYQSQEAIEMLVGRSRRNGGFCARLTEHIVRECETETRHASRQFRSTRYLALNVQSFPNYGTVEARLHQGTLNAKKIIAWVDFIQSVFEFATSDMTMIPALQRSNLEWLLGQLVANGGLNYRTASYLVHRAQTLNPGLVFDAEPTEPATIVDEQQVARPASEYSYRRLNDIVGDYAIRSNRSRMVFAS